MAKSENWREMSPIGLQRYAIEFITVGRDALDKHRKRHIADRGPGRDHVPYNLPPPFPIYYNFLHGMELGLKAYLLHVNAVTIGDLKSEQLGHNLANLLDKALEHDLCIKCPELTDSIIQVIRFSSSAYADKRFEYIRIGGLQLKPIDEITDAADTLINGLNQLDMQSSGEVRLAQEKCR